MTDQFIGYGSPTGLTRLLLLADLTQPGRQRLADLRDELFDPSWRREPPHLRPMASLVDTTAHYAESVYTIDVVTSWPADVVGAALYVHHVYPGRKYPAQVLALNMIVVRAAYLEHPLAHDELVRLIPEWLVTATDAEPDAWRRLDDMSRAWRGSLAELVATERSLRPAS